MSDFLDKLLKEELKLMYIYGFKFEKIAVEGNKAIIYCKVPIASDFEIGGTEMAGEFMAKTVKEIILKNARLNGIPNFDLAIRYETFNMKWRQNHYDFAKSMIDIGYVMEK